MRNCPDADIDPNKISFGMLFAGYEVRIVKNCDHGLQKKILWSQFFTI